MVIKEEEKAPEKLSQKISTMSLTGAHKKVVVWVLYLFLEKKQNPHESRSACFNSHHLQTSIVSLCILNLKLFSETYIPYDTHNPLGIFSGGISEIIMCNICHLEAMVLSVCLCVACLSIFINLHK